ncbi:MAG: proline racemase family protein, partial [Chloroflexota bacterium]|nr:proline racemase family protein [Chloroflexota bacterium]
MCGHGVIAIATALVEERLYPVTLPETTIRFETPAGLVTARAHVTAAGWGGPEVDHVRFSNVPSYLAARDIEVRPEGIELSGRARDEGTLRVDVGFGGAYYGIVDAADLGLRVVPEEIDRLTRAGTAITDVLRRDHRPEHPTDPDLGFVYGTIIVERGSADGETSSMRNLTVFAAGEVDRSPCGSGTSALLAQAWSRGTLDEGAELINTGITGQSFRARLGGRTWIAQQEAVETSIEGRAFVTGYPSLIVDDRDPLGRGFLLG